ncbi:insulin-like peptide receptor [Ptychodera flava]|uniref:insulin-like peptide receptor n=1 Tax=Ptychodera flava TaxID=63121 RepID=UPI00396A09DE
MSTTPALTVSRYRTTSTSEEESVVKSMMKPNKTVSPHNLPITAIVTVFLMSTVDCRMQEHVCKTIDIRNTVSQFNQLENCTVIEGNLKILLIDFGKPSDYEHLKFPKLLEITGYFLTFRVKGLQTYEHIFPNLAVIRGQELFYNYALVAFEMQDLREIGLHGLVTIQRGGVRIEKNPNLCYLDTVNFDLLVKPETENHIQNNKWQSECANVCPSNKCTQWTWLQSHETLCWTSNYCQIACYSNCRDNCHKITYDCTCHSECVGGCTGPNPDECIACRHFFHEGRCVTSCPAGTFSYGGRRCITRNECPETWKLMDDQCVQECPPLYTSNSTHPRLCQPCNGPCPKVCVGMTIDSVGAAQMLRGCTVIDGSLKISVHGGNNVIAELEENLKMIEEVVDYIEISHSYPVVSLTFLKNLRRIGGRELYNGYVFYILDNQNLQHLFDWDSYKNLTVGRGKLFFHFNPKLCLNQIWEFESRLNLSVHHDKLDISRTTNGDQVGCEVANMAVYALPNQRLIFLHWIEVQLPDVRDLLSYQVFWRVAPERNITEFDGQDACGSIVWQRQDVRADETSTALTDLEPWTQYAIIVKAYTIAESSKGAKSDIMYVKTLQDVPTPPTNIQVIPKSPTELLLLWDPPSKPNGNVTYYYVYYWEVEKDVELFELKDYCVEGLEIPSDRHEPSDQGTIDKPDNMTDGCCACPKDEKQLLIEEEEALMRKEFENFLHNSVYVHNPIPIHELERLKREAELGRGAQSEYSESMTTRSMLDDTAYISQSNLSHTVDVHTAAPSSRLDPVNATTQPTDTTEEDEVPFMAVVYFKTEISLTDLKHFMEYSFELRACNNNDMCSAIGVSNGRTLADTSADNIPGNVTATVLNNRTHNREVLVQWQEPPDPNGLLIFHEIAYALLNDEGGKSRVVWQGDTMETRSGDDNEIPQKPAETIHCIPHKHYRAKKGYLLKGLAPGNYSVRVRSSSLAGNGSWTTPVFFVMSKEVLPPAQGPVIASANLFAVIGGIVAGVISIIIVIFIIGCRVVRKRYMNNGLPNGVLYASYNPEYMSASDVYVPDEWEVPREKILLIRELGQGSFGMVYEGEAKDIHDGEGKIKVAIKTVNENASIRDRIEFLNEASVMKAFNCNHVVRLLGVVSKGQPTLVVMELMAQGDLKNWLRSHRPDEPDNEGRQPPTVADILQIAGEIADGMAYLAAQKFVHRDLAARNCMVSLEGTVKIGDFGMTRDIYETDYYRKGGKGLLPVRWMAPESLKDGIFTSLSDVWSYGVVLWEMATLAEQPYQGLTNEQVLKYVIDGNSLDKPTGCPERLFGLMTMCWRYNPKMRPSFLDLIENLESNNELSPQFKNVAFYHSDERHRIKDSHKLEESIPLMLDVEPEFDHSKAPAAPSMENPSTAEDKADKPAPVDYSHEPQNGVLNGIAVKMPKC